MAKYLPIVSGSRGAISVSALLQQNSWNSDLQNRGTNTLCWMFWPNSLDNSLQPQPYPWGDKNWSVLAGLREASGLPSNDCL